MKRAIPLLLALLAFPAVADDWQICWNPPTTFENGDPLLEQDLDYYTLYINAANVMSFDVIVGTWCVVWTTHVEGTYEAKMTVTHINGKTSAISPTSATFTLGPRTPGVVTNLTVTKL